MDGDSPDPSPQKQPKNEQQDASDNEPIQSIFMAKQDLLVKIGGCESDYRSLWENYIKCSPYVADPDVWDLAIKKNEGFWESSLMDDHAIIQCIVKLSPTSLWHFPTKVFEPDGPLFFDPDNDNVVEIFRKFFEDPKTTYKLVGKLAEKMDPIMWDEYDFLKSWFRLGACLEKYSFLPADFDIRSSDDENEELMGIVARNCFRNQWAQKTFEAFACPALKSNKTAVIKLIQSRPCLLEKVDEKLQNDVDVKATAYSVAPRGVPEEVSCEHSDQTYEYYVPHSDRGILLEEIKNRFGHAHALMHFQDIGVPGPALDCIADFLHLPTFARAAHNLSIDFPFKVKLLNADLDLTEDEDRSAFEDWSASTGGLWA